MLARKTEEIQAIEHGVDYLSFKQEREMPLVWLFLDECLTGDTEIITSKAHTPMKDIITQFNSGKETNVLGFDSEKKEYSHYPIKEVYSKGKRKICEIMTETGKKLRCTPEHRVLTRHGFASAFSVDEIATPLIQHYSEDIECIKARLLGHLFGDGWASEKKESLGFSGKINPNDLNIIKKDLSSLNLKSSSIYSRETQSKITDKNNKETIVKGKSHSIQASSKAFRYFKPLGIIAGGTKLQKKAEYLSGLKIQMKK